MEIAQSLGDGGGKHPNFKNAVSTPERKHA